MRERLRMLIMSLYGIDIDTKGIEYKNSLNAFTINLDDLMIRVTVNDGVGKEARLARLQWASQVKSFRNTICEPIPSKSGELIEEIEIGKWKMLLSLHRSAKGKLINVDEVTPLTLICVGDMLGALHKVSMDMDLKNNDPENDPIPEPEVFFEERLGGVLGMMDPDMMRAVDRIVEGAVRIPKTHENYGVCYGEFDLHNIIVDTNNIHLFDFDRSIKGHYLYDVASFVVSLLSNGYMPGVKSEEVVFKHFVPWFRIGYALNKPCKKTEFDELETFIGLRGIGVLVNLLEKYNQEPLPEIKAQADYVSGILKGKDVFEGMDIVRSQLFAMK